MEPWLQKSGFHQTSDGTFRKDVNGKYRITISQWWDGLEQRYEWSAEWHGGGINGRDLTPQDAIRDQIEAMGARMASIAELKEHLERLLSE